MRATAVIFKIHSYLGLISGVFILVFSLTGAILLFSDEIDQTIYSDLLKTSDTERKFSFDHAYQLVSASYSDYIPYRISRGIHDKEETIEVGLQKNNFEDRFSVYVDPVTGKMKGKLQNSFTELVLKLHYTFFLGKTGELIAAIFSLSLTGSIITGTIVYRKYFWKVLCFKIQINHKNWRTRSSGLHRVLGVWALLFNFIIAFSGFWLLKHTFDFKTHFSKRKPSERATPLIASIDTACIYTLKKIPDLTIHYISLPRSKGDNLIIYGDIPGRKIYGKYNNFIEVDPNTGKVLKVSTEDQIGSSEKVDNTLYTLHFGQYGGLTLKIIYAFFSVTTAVISISGYLLWWKRKKPKTR